MGPPVRTSPPGDSYLDRELLGSAAGPEPSFTLLDSPSLIPISVPGSPSAISFRSDSPKLHHGRGQSESAENHLEASVPGSTRWGCWSALTSPPRFRSGTLILGPEPEIQSGSNASRRSHSVPRAGSFDVRLSSPVEAIAQSTSRVPPLTNTSTEFTSTRVEGTSQTDRASVRSVASSVQTIHLRKDPHDKPRRLFVLPNRGVLSVTMRGCFDIVPKADFRHPA
ncbi:uncharacterized protein TRAVEDRAFT_163204, partial [Trametes versicolor FP-101664 SS1]|uniref:uncharacterized protein n=1 Tax=Trametes versicolor (strain FP-101664) TaxID=717944 RepID=UPI0004622B33